MQHGLPDMAVCENVSKATIIRMIWFVKRSRFFCYCDVLFNGIFLPTQAMNLYLITFAVSLPLHGFGSGGNSHMPAVVKSVMTNTKVVMRS